MADLTLVWDPDAFSADFALGPTDILTGNDLQTSIIVSLFTDPGWWANAFEADDWGCRLIELRRAKHTNATLLAARDYCRIALQWLIDDEVASAVDVQTSWQGSTLVIAINLTQATGVTHFSFVWDQI